MKIEQDLFRKQVIDELNNKLNGEILLNPNISSKVFLLCGAAWLALMFSIYQLIEINSPKIITGKLVLQENNNLVARFMLPIDFANQVRVGEIIPIQLIGLSETQHLNTNIKISHIDQTLSVSIPPHSSEANIANLKVDASLIGSAVLFQNQKFLLSEGIIFSFTLNSKPEKLLPWLQKYLAGANK
ncbi:hypothetical protein [Cellvibrio sp.]|uniref:hypothetical protein n=1 Tax=Cellvibrio sp. TaxID=1965322 RepID=UPI0039648256